MSQRILSICTLILALLLIATHAKANMQPNL